MKRGLATVLVAFSAIAALSACGTDSDATGYGTDNSVKVNNHQKLNVEGSDDTQIYTVTLEDGRECVITDGSKSGGVWCADE